MRLLIFLIAIISLPATGIWIYKSITFKQNCSGHLDRAATASTVEIAKEELGKAISYLENNNLTAGSTHILYSTPDNDIAYWYKNLKSAYQQLEKVSATGTDMEKTNELLKLHENLIGRGDKGSSHVITPPRIALYPNQSVIYIGSLIGIIFVFGFILLRRIK